MFLPWRAQLDANKAVVRRLYAEVFQAGDLDVADDLVHPDARDFADAQDRRGPQRVKEVATLLRAASATRPGRSTTCGPRATGSSCTAPGAAPTKARSWASRPRTAASRPATCTCSVSRR